MGLTIELSFSISKLSSVTQFKQILSDLAEKYNSTSNYFIHEIEGHSTTIDRNDCIHVVEFSILQENILNYIKNIMRVKKVKIDSIHTDKKGTNLIYASKKYLSMMNVNKYPVIDKPMTENKLLELVAKTII